MANYLITSLSDLQLKIKLGVSAREREHAQLVKVSFYIYQYILPNVVFNDKEEDYICYDRIAQIISDFCQGKEFRVIEFLCFQIHQLVKSITSKEVKVRIIIEKCKPDMSLLVGSSKCEYSDIEG